MLETLRELSALDVSRDLYFQGVGMGITVCALVYVAYSFVRLGLRVWAWYEDVNDRLDDLERGGGKDARTDHP